MYQFVCTTEICDCVMPSAPSLSSSVVSKPAVQLHAETSRAGVIPITLQLSKSALIASIFGAASCGTHFMTGVVEVDQDSKCSPEQLLG